MYTMLSLWRIENTTTYEALFILFAMTNTLYCCINLSLMDLMLAWWDVFMDWSLMQPHAPHPFLRTDLGYRSPWVYLY